MCTYSKTSNSSVCSKALLQILLAQNNRENCECVSVFEDSLLHLGAAVPAYSFIDLVEYDGHMFKAAAEELEALRFDLLKLLNAYSGCSRAGIKC